MEDKVINYIYDQFLCGRLLPGDRLPAERKLSETLGVSRSHVRAALQRLEFNGVVKTWPQSGTVMADRTVTEIKDLLANMRNIPNFDFYSLVHVRTVLECDAIKLCALNHTASELKTLKAAMEDFENNIDTPMRDEKDMAFHLSIVQTCHNPVLASILLSIIPDVLKYYHMYHPCTVPPLSVIQEHRDLFNSIEARDAEAAEKSLLHHFKTITTFSEKFKGDVPRSRTQFLPAEKKTVNML